MENYQLEKMYEDEDEIDLVELLKTVIREKTLVAIVAIVFTILAAAFAFYKESKPKNYGVNITLSEQTNAKIKQYETMYPSTSLVFNKIIESSFETLLNKNSDEIIVIPAENTAAINNILKEEYDFVKIVDVKNRSYKLFAKVQGKNAGTLSEKILETVNSDTENFNNEFTQRLNEEIILSDNKLANLKSETENLNKQIMNVIKNNFNDTSKENIKDNLAIISPILYVEYKQKLDALNTAYLQNIDLKNIKKEVENIFAFDGERNITVIDITTPNSSSGLNPKLIVLIGAFLGICAGMFLAIIKNPLKEIFREIKEEKK